MPAHQPRRRARDPDLLTPGRVVVAFDDDHIALAGVVGFTEQAGRTLPCLRLAPGDIEEYVQAVVRAASDPLYV